jgi:hypothetical protein
MKKEVNQLSSILPSVSYPFDGVNATIDSSQHVLSLQHHLKPPSSISIGCVVGRSSVWTDVVHKVAGREAPHQSQLPIIEILQLELRGTHPPAIRLIVGKERSSCQVECLSLQASSKLLGCKTATVKVLTRIVPASAVIGLVHGCAVPCLHLRLAEDADHL